MNWDPRGSVLPDFGRHRVRMVAMAMENMKNTIFVITSQQIIVETSNLAHVVGQ